MTDTLIRRDCKSCGHYELYKMITGGPYGYSGDIPCLRCCRFQRMNDEYTAINSHEIWIDKSGLTAG